MKPRDSFYLLKLGLAAYRLANMASKEAGPLDIFQRLRMWIMMKEYDCKEYDEEPAQDLRDIQATHMPRRRRVVFISKQFVYWRSLRDLFRCPYCLGVWFAFILLFAPGWFVDWLAVAGVQHVVQKAVEK